MIAGQNVVAVVPARGGSKSVPDKNIRLLGGKPLLAWSIEVARAIPAIDRVIVSTDNNKIAEVAERYGAEVYTRPAHLATDTALVTDALRDLHAQLEAEGYRADIVALLEPTSPLRTSYDVEACLDKLCAEHPPLDSVATFTPAHLNPHRAWTLRGEAPEPFIAGAVPWLPRQKLPEAYQLSGAVYAYFAGRLPEDSVAPLFGRAGAVVMPPERSVDIDSAQDFLVAEALLWTLDRHSDERSDEVRSTLEDAVENMEKDTKKETVEAHGA